MPFCHQNQVWPPLAEPGHQEVTEHCPQGYLWFQCPEHPNLLVGAWATLVDVELEEDCPCQWWHDQCHPKHAQYGLYLGSRWVMVPAPAHMLQEILSLQQPYMGKRCRLAAECCIHKFFFGMEGRSFPECPATWWCWRFHPELPMTFFLLYEYRPIPPLSRHRIEPVPEYSNIGGSHHLINGQSVFHLYDQGCSALSSWRQHIASVRAATFDAP